MIDGIAILDGMIDYRRSIEAFSLLKLVANSDTLMLKST